MELVDLSYDISNIKGEWIVPANPRYYDIMEKADNEEEAQAVEYHSDENAGTSLGDLLSKLKL